MKDNVVHEAAGKEAAVSTVAPQEDVAKEHVANSEINLVQLPLGELHPFEGHPFKVLDDELMEQTVESIRTVGILSPLVARPDANGGYEILSGHRRLHAAQLVRPRRVF